MTRELKFYRLSDLKHFFPFDLSIIDSTPPNPNFELETPFEFTINAVNHLNNHLNFDLQLLSFKYLQQVLEIIEPRHRCESEAYGFIRDKITINIDVKFEPKEFENPYI